MIQTSQILSFIKDVNDYDDGFDSKLTLLINASIAKLKAEGIENVFTEGDNMADLYMTCISLNIEMLENKSADMQYLQSLYVTYVVTLRNACSSKV